MKIILGPYYTTKKFNEKLPEPKVYKHSNFFYILMKITFITTGGTIDKDYQKPTKGYGFEITDPAVDRILKRINPSFEYEIILLLKKDSLDLTDGDREMILEACQNTSAEKIIISHGTDTMHLTGKKLSEISEKVIIITGATRPERFSDSDADFNLGCAIGAINILDNGIYISMHGRIFPWDKCKRDEESGRFEGI